MRFSAIVPPLPRILRPIAWLAMGLALSGCGSLGYYAHVAKGQGELIVHRRDVAKVVDDPATDPAVKRKLQLAQICIAAGKDAIAQPLLDDVAAAIETHKLEDWEDRETVAGALTFLVQNSKKIQGDAKAKQAMFERICRLDPVQALTI